MKNIFFMLVFFLFTTAISLSAIGSKGLIVSNHIVGEAVPDLLELQLRNEHDCKNTDHAMCDCWANFEDQPTVQGDARAIMILLNPLFPCYGTKIDSNGKLTLIFPSPAFMKKALTKLEVADFYSFCSDDNIVSTTQYLNLIKDGKIPLAGVGNTYSNNNFLYHNYFHDAFNHVAYKAIEPIKLREAAKSHAKIILDFQSEIKKQLKDNMLKILFKLTTDILAYCYDTNMGSLNNLFCSYLHESPNLTSLSLEKIKNLCELASTYVHFGLKFNNRSYEDGIIVFSGDNNTLLNSLYTVALSTCLKEVNIDKSTTKRLINSKQKLAKISQISLEELETLSKELKAIILKSLKINEIQNVSTKLQTTTYSNELFIKYLQDNLENLKKSNK